MGVNDDKTSNPLSPKELQPFKCCPYKDTAGKKGKKGSDKSSKGGKEKKPSHYVATWW